MNVFHTLDVALWDLGKFLLQKLEAYLGLLVIVQDIPLEVDTFSTNR